MSSTAPRRSFHWASIVLAVCAACGGESSSSATHQIEVLHAFSGTDGAWSRGSLVRDGTALFGRTSIGGDFDSGTVFRIGTDGSGFAALYSFTAGGDNGLGNQPHHNAMLLRDRELIGAALYGGNTLGGAASRPERASSPPPIEKSGNGTVFRIGTDGAAYSVLLELDGGVDAPSLPHSPPVLGPDGRTLYGMTAAGGAHDTGTLYAVGVDGAGFRLLHSFAKEEGDEPHGMVAFDGAGNLIGMTRKGGSPPSGQSAGVVFRYDLVAARYEVLHEFEKDEPTNGDTNDHGFFTLVDGFAYATTELGGAYLRGTIFRIHEDGSGFQILHSFGGSPGDGVEPYGSLVRQDGWLYGTTTMGGTNGDGTLFRYRVADGSYEVLASFDRASSGALPEDNLVFDEGGRTVFGLTQAGGVNDPNGTEYFGTVFAFRVPDED